MTRRFSYFQRLAAFLVPVFALVMVFSGCAPEFNDMPSDNFATSETPNTPRNVKTKALSDHSVKISWDPVEGCTDYKVYFSPDNAPDMEDWYLSDHQIPDTSFVDDVELEPATTYYYKVAAYTNGKFFRESPASASKSVTTLAAGATPIVEVFLDPPANINANASSPTNIGLTWQSVQNATGYNVYSSSFTDGDYSFRAYVVQYSSPIWNDTECQPGETRYYRVTTLSEDGEGEKSDPVSATTETVSSVPSAPTNVAASADGTTITITWTTVSNATWYDILRADSEYGSYMSRGYSYSGSYTDMNLTSQMTYYYKVVAKNSYGSTESTSVSATTGTSSGGGSPGSQAATAITLSPSYSTWTSGTLNADAPAVWYRFYITNSSSTYCLMGKDGYVFSNYTGDVKFEIYDSGLNLIKTLDAGNGGSYESPGGVSGSNYQKGTWTSGYWYVKVVPYGGYTSNYGTYAIYFY